MAIGRRSEPRRVRCSLSCASSSTPITLVVDTKVRKFERELAIVTPVSGGARDVKSLFTRG
eukprot:4928552-Prymnesium_polylepis.1